MGETVCRSNGEYLLSRRCQVYLHLPMALRRTTCRGSDVAVEASTCPRKFERGVPVYYTFIRSTPLQSALTKLSRDAVHMVCCAWQKCACRQRRTLLRLDSQKRISSRATTEIKPRSQLAIRLTRVGES